MLPESNAILRYPAEGTPFFPSTPIERAHVRRWMFLEQSALMPNIGWARLIRRWMPEDCAMRARLPWLDEGGAAALGVMERALQRRPFLVGNRSTIADIALYGYGHLAGEAGLDPSRWPAVDAWLGRVRDQPGHIPLEVF
jgi:glutathione S-transferase